MLRDAQKSDAVTQFRFKIVRVRSGDPAVLSSSDAYDTPLSLVYPVGEWVEAKIGGILVFGNSPLVMAQLQLHEQLWQAEVEERLPLPSGRLKLPVGIERLYFSMGNAEKMVAQATDLWGGRSPDCTLDPWPQGTEAWRRIKLVERLA